MICIEVIKSHDPLAFGTYDFEFNQISIGRSRQCDLIFFDVELPMKFLSLKFIQQQLVIQSAAREPCFFINGKKVSGTIKIKKNDIIAFGMNQIRIVDFKDTNEQLDFTGAFDEFTRKTPELKFALEYIEQVLIDMEKDSDV